MTIKNITDLKAEWETGDEITQVTCINLIDSCHNDNVSHPTPNKFYETQVPLPEDGDSFGIAQIVSNGSVQTVEGYVLPSGATVDVQIDIRERTTPGTTGTNLLSAPVTLDSDTESGTIANANVTANQHLVLIASNVVGVPTSLFLKIEVEES